MSDGSSNILNYKEICNKSLKFGHYSPVRGSKLVRYICKMF